VPTRLELLSDGLRYDRDGGKASGFYRFDAENRAPYRGGQGAGEMLNSKRNLHSRLTANPNTTAQTVPVPDSVRQGFLATLRHLTNDKHGHFSERHPDGKDTGKRARTRILDAAARVVFQTGDLIWVEWDTDSRRIVSLGWHYYYRWAYTDTVRRRRWARQGACSFGTERQELFPLRQEKERGEVDGESVGPAALSSVRRLFGYVSGENDKGSDGIGQGDHAQLMGRISVNAALEIVEDGDDDKVRFERATFLKDLGMPRPSAVEHYLKQPHHPKSRPLDRAQLVTYGNADGCDNSRRAGRAQVLLRSCGRVRDQAMAGR
jgi:hypothetical protein